jgi:MSHA biogenesis protein MshP
MKAGIAKPQRRQQFAREFGRGFALVSALFLIVVIALLAAVAVRVTTAQQQTVSLALQQARALSAARAGIDWAAYNATVNLSCAGGTLSLPAASLAGYTVVVTCASTAYTDGSGSYVAFTIASTATYGTYGTPDFVQRVVRATFTNET